eukprot:6148737-Lingulodinium_polyedra.AAC.1
MGPDLRKGERPFLARRAHRPGAGQGPADWFASSNTTGISAGGPSMSPLHGGGGAGAALLPAGRLPTKRSPPI